MESIGNVCRFLNGGTPSGAEAKFFGGNNPWITSADINGPVVTRARTFITDQAISSSATNKVSAGTVLLVTRTGVGKVAIAGVDLCFSQDITAVIPNSSRLNTGYLVHFLRTKQDYFLSMARGATIKGVTRDVISNLKLPLPSLTEQRRIAAILDKADALRTKRREAQSQLDRLAQSIFVEMFGDPVTNNRNFPICELSDVVDGKFGVKAGPFGSALKKEEYTSSGYRVYGQEQVIAGRFDIGDYFISPRKFEQLKTCAVEAGDILVSLVGSFGRVLIVPNNVQPGIINPRLLKITPNKKIIEPAYLAALIQHPSIQMFLGRVAHGGTMGILNAGLLKQIKVVLPSLEMQQAFIARIASLESCRLVCMASIRQHDLLFSSLQQRAFSGEL